MKRTITYAIDSSGLVWSRVGNEFAVPDLDYEGMNPENGYEMKYNLGKIDMRSFIQCGERLELKWTKKISIAEKNRHRRFWGMKPLSG